MNPSTAAVSALLDGLARGEDIDALTKQIAAEFRVSEVLLIMAFQIDVLIERLADTIDDDIANPPEFIRQTLAEHFSGPIYDHPDVKEHHAI